MMKHLSVIDYNTAKAGVDTFDQITSYNSILRKSDTETQYELLLGRPMMNTWELNS